METNPPLASDTPAVVTPSPARPRPVAPVWHTVVFLVIIAGAAALGAQQQGTGMIRHGRLFTYLFTIGWEWLLVAYIWWGIRKSGFKLRDLVGGRWKSPEDALLDVAIAVGFWIVAALILAGVAYAVGLAKPGQLAEAQKRIDPLKPVGGLESAVWIVLAATAGFCEEVMFRGYFMTQLRAWTSSAIVAVVAQAIVFGAAHAYQGGRLIWVIMTYGLLFGILAWWRRSLRPGMMAHAMQDTLSGLIRNLPVR